MNKKILSILMGVLCATGFAISPVLATDEPMVISETPEHLAEDSEIIEEDVTAESGAELISTFEATNGTKTDPFKLRFGTNRLLFGASFKEETELATTLLFSIGGETGVSGSSEYGFLLGNNVVISSWVRKDVFVAANTLTIDKEAYIGGDVFAAADAIAVQSNIGGDLSVVASELILDGAEIKGNVNAEVSRITIQGNVVIEGLFNYSEGAEIVGAENLTAEHRQTFVSNVADEVDSSTVFVDTLISWISLFVATAAVLLIRRRVHDELKDINTSNQIITNLGLGFVAVVLIPAIMITLIMTIVGIPLALILGAAYVVLLYITSGFTGIWLGHMLFDKLFNKKVSPYLDALVGTAIIVFAALIPYVGILITFLSIIFGFGYIVNNCICSSKATKKTVKK